MDLGLIRDLYSHMEWADAAVWSVVLGFDEASKDEKIRNYCYHTHLVQWAFLSTWRGEEIGSQFPTFEDLPSMLAWGRVIHGGLQDYIAGLKAEDTAFPLPVAWAKMVEEQIGRPPDVPTRGETIIQVALHSTYHRGQINARLSELKAKPPSVDYIAWLWIGRPRPEWPG